MFVERGVDGLDGDDDGYDNDNGDGDGQDGDSNVQRCFWKEEARRQRDWLMKQPDYRLEYLDVKVLEYLGVGVLLVYLNIEILDICNAEV